jgi:hypothetical protein
VVVVRAEERPTLTSKGFEKLVVKCYMEEKFKRRFFVSDFGGKMIYEECGSFKSIIPEF